MFNTFVSWLQVDIIACYDNIGCVAFLKKSYVKVLRSVNTRVELKAIQENDISAVIGKVIFK